MSTIQLGTIGPVTYITVAAYCFYFSYQTCVAYEAPGEGRVVSENVWSRTTGAHLTAIDGGSKEAKAKRVKHDEFERRLQAVLQKFERQEGAHER